MEVLGIGPLELIFIIIILLVVLGPADIVELAHKIGAGIRKLRASPAWNTAAYTARALRNLPNTLARETGINDLRSDLLRPADLNQTIGKPPMPAGAAPAPPGDTIPAAWTTPPEGAEPNPPAAPALPAEEK
jgi:Sec-independent protein translocase protein TatA